MQQPQQTWRPIPEAIERDAQVQDNKNCQLAVQALELAVKHHSADEGHVANKQVTDTAEWFYRWIKSNDEPAMTWPQPDDWPQS